MRVAITGGIAEGKSTVLGFLRDAGYSTVSADEVARESFDSSDVQAGLGRILGVTGAIDRDFLREKIAESPAIRRDVNRLMHADIRRRTDESGATFCEIPLLVETCGQRNFDAVWVVQCGREEQLRRLLQRYDSAHAERLLSSQLPTGAKVPFADLVIRTNQAFETVQRIVLGAARHAS